MDRTIGATDCFYTGVAGAAAARAFSCRSIAQCGRRYGCGRTHVHQREVSPALAAWSFSGIGNVPHSMRGNAGLSGCPLFSDGSRTKSLAPEGPSDASGTFFTFGNIRLVRHTLIADELALLTRGLGDTSAGAGVQPALRGGLRRNAENDRIPPFGDVLPRHSTGGDPMSPNHNRMLVAFAGCAAFVTWKLAT